jgi:hypothetical protein
MFERIAAIAAGYLFAILIGHWATSALMRIGWLRVTAPLGSTGPANPTSHPEHPAAVGLLERTLYVAAWQLDARGFIGLWLALKVAGNWKRWTEDTTRGTGIIAGGTSFNLFLLGAGTSLAFGIGGARITELLGHNDWAQALLLGAVLVGASVGLGWFLKRGWE